MPKDEIVVGKSYVNEVEAVIRQVVEETDSHHVMLNAFDLATGKLIPVPHQVCHRRQLARWADREATEQETARTHPYEPSAWFDLIFPRPEGTVPLDRAKTALTGMPEQLIMVRGK